MKNKPDPRRKSLTKLEKALYKAQIASENLIEKKCTKKKYITSLEYLEYDFPLADSIEAMLEDLGKVSKWMK
jgi:hypothetical protein